MVRDKNAVRKFSEECEYEREVMRFRGGERGWGVTQVVHPHQQCAIQLYYLHSVVTRIRTVIWSQSWKSPAPSPSS